MCITFHRRLPWKVVVLRTELALRSNIAGRQRDMQRDRDGSGLLIGNGIEPQCVDREEQRVT